MRRNDIRLSPRYKRVRVGRGKGGAGEVGTLEMQFSGLFRIIEFVTDQHWIEWTGYNGGLFNTQQAAADAAIRELERNRFSPKIEM
jgi:hypothetical protein